MVPAVLNFVLEVNYNTCSIFLIYKTNLATIAQFIPFDSSKPYSIVLNDFRALETALKEKVEIHRHPTGNTPTHYRAPCFQTSFAQPYSFALHVEPSREGPTGTKTGTIVLVKTTPTIDRKTSKKRNEIRHLNSSVPGKFISVFRETLFPVAYTSCQGTGIPLCDKDGSAVKAKTASIFLDHDFLQEYEVAVGTPGTASSAVSTFREMCLQMEKSPFEVLTPGPDGSLLRGVVIKIDSEKAAIMLPPDKYPCSSAEKKLERPASTVSTLAYDIFEVPTGTFQNKFIPVI